jgi:hypothetical protein
VGVEKINIEKFLELAENFPVLDVRSPGEYRQAHIPGAFSLPLFTDEERKVVGTAYKQQSREAAIKIGLDFFGPKMRSTVERVETILKCWRLEVGGSRLEVGSWKPEVQSSILEVGGLMLNGECGEAPDAGSNATTSNVQLPTSNAESPTSNLEPQTPNLERKPSKPKPPTSNVQPPTSNIDPSQSNIARGALLARGYAKRGGGLAAGFVRI